MARPRETERIDRARDLYLKIDNKGKKMYSSKEITKILSREFNINLSINTLNNWAKKYAFKKELEEIIEGLGNFIVEEEYLGKEKTVKESLPLLAPVRHLKIQALKNTYDAVCELQERAIKGIHAAFDGEIGAVKPADCIALFKTTVDVQLKLTVPDTIEPIEVKKEIYILPGEELKEIKDKFDKMYD